MMGLPNRTRGQIYDWVKVHMLDNIEKVFPRWLSASHPYLSPSAIPFPTTPRPRLCTYPFSPAAILPGKYISQAGWSFESHVSRTKALPYSIPRLQLRPLTSTCSFRVSGASDYRQIVRPSTTEGGVHVLVLPAPTDARVS